MMSVEVPPVEVPPSAEVVPALEVPPSAEIVVPASEKATDTVWTSEDGNSTIPSLCLVLSYDYQITI